MTKNTAYSHTTENIPVFIFFVIIFCAFLTPAQRVYSLSPAGFGKDSKFSFSVYPLAGILYGQAEEIVYRNSADADYLSQLLWDIKPLAYAGAGLSFSMNELRPAPGLYADVSVKAGIPALTGRMEDRDWQLSDASILTNYSVHDNYTTRAFLMNAALGISLPLRYRDRVIAFLKIEGAVSYMYFDWIARDGYYQYNPSVIKPWDPADPKTPVVGDQLMYYQHWLMVSPGIAALIPAGSRWLVEVSLNAVSGPVWAWARDEHIGKGYEYYDYPTGGILLEPGFEVSFSFNKRLRLTADVSYRYIRGSRGKTLSQKVGNADYSTWNYNMAGAGFSALDAGLTLKVFF
jgi:outer membrane protease